MHAYPNSFRHSRPLCHGLLLAAIIALSTGLMASCGQRTAFPEGDRVAQCHLRTVDRLSFGLSGPQGDIGDEAWRAFLHGQIAPRFPAGHTVYEAQGQWLSADGKIVQERSRVVELVHDGAPHHRHRINEIVAQYKHVHQQEAVLVTRSTATVCI